MKRRDKEVIVVTVFAYHNTMGDFGATGCGFGRDRSHQLKFAFQFVIRRPMPKRVGRFGQHCLAITKSAHAAVGSERSDRNHRAKNCGVQFAEEMLDLLPMVKCLTYRQMNSVPIYVAAVCLRRYCKIVSPDDHCEVLW